MPYCCLMRLLTRMPPTTRSVYTLQQAQGIRAKLAPFESTGNGQFPSYLNALYISAGNAIVEGQWYPQFEKQLAGMDDALRRNTPPNRTFMAKTDSLGAGTFRAVRFA